MKIQTSTQNSDLILAQEFQMHFSNASHKHGILDNGKHKNDKVNNSGQTKSIM